MYNDKISINYLKKDWKVKNSQIFSGDLKCCLNSIFKHIERLGYNSGVYGWNYDIYKIDNFYFVDGYRYPHIVNRLDYFKMKKLNKRFEEQQKKLSDKFFTTENKKIKKYSTYERLLKNLTKKQQDYFIKRLSKLI